jgi:peptidoglycan/LPS O-acetylase OafA/YrhL
MDRAPQLIRPLHGLRGIAALSVVVGHSSSWTDVPPWPVAPGLGVALFFVLSGYLMGHLYLPQQASPANVWAYLVARFARVYPLFVVVVVLSVPFGLLLLNGEHPFDFTEGDVWRHLLLVGAGSTVWTIAVEMQFYGLFAVLWLAAWRHELLLLIGLLVFSAAMFIVGFPEGRIDLLRYLHLFALGIAAAVIARRYSALIAVVAPWVLPATLTAYLAMLSVAPALYDPQIVYADPIACAVVTLLVLSAAAASSSPVGRLLGSPVMVWLGEVSYGIYLLHRPIIEALKVHPPAFLSGVPLLLLVLGLTLLAACGANTLIERPARQFIRGTAQPQLSS